MTTDQNEVSRILGEQSVPQLDKRVYIVRENAGRLRLVTGNHYVPDLFVVLRVLMQPRSRRPGTLEV